jgi:signal transduction histidine kinase
MPARDLTAVLTNLVENAAHYGRGDDGRLTLTISGELDQTRLRLRVEDRGTGIDPAEAGHIFDAFYRPASSLQRNPSSTGVGLAIVRRALERWHGTIEVVQAEPTGAAFIVDLPLAVPLPWGAGGGRGGRG